ncbi:MAG: rhodanese-like domain-containing protein [Chromatiales bacterium]|nr:MAG: rhodanese-like domain-containing protein [Chromatiales bacterium]
MDRLLEFTNNHPLLVAGTIMMALAVIFYELRMRTRGLVAVSTAQAVQLINNGARVVDVREQAQFDAGHIVGAVHAAPDALADDKRLKKNRPVIVVCDNGLSSGRCSDQLRGAGFESAYSLRGGLTAWQQDNLPLISGGKD